MWIHKQLLELLSASSPAAEAPLLRHGAGTHAIANLAFSTRWFACVTC